jgi:hypothetical protein
VNEGDGTALPGRRGAAEVPVDDHPGLARSRAGDRRERRVGRDYLPLRRVRRRAEGRPIDGTYEAATGVGPAVSHRSALSRPAGTAQRGAVALDRAEEVLREVALAQFSP